MYSTGRQLWVRMKSDYGSTNYRKGFAAEFEAVRWRKLKLIVTKNADTKNPVYTGDADSFTIKT